ncbi:MAG: hypothetical protein HQ581_12095, partial [Planctomycetes bacterium]|nr:hypothetical protein [Planctomycetota bacterium]
MFACRLHAHSLFLGVPLLCVLFLSLPPSTASAAHVLWNYSAAGNWNDGGNWAGGAVPGSISTDSAEIGQGTGNGGTAIVDSVVPNVLRWYLAEQSSETGTLEIRPGGSLTSTQNNTHYVSVRGTGTLNMSGGNLNVAGELRVAGIGSAAPGLVNQSGGRIELTTAGRHLQLAHDTGSQATWNLSGSATELVVADALVLGRNGTGIFRHSDGGTVRANRLFVNQYGNGNGTYELSGATSLLDIGNVMYVGYQGTGLFQQSGGQVTLPNELSVGEGNGGNGTYELSGGSVAARRLFVGNLNGSTGRFVQTGGTVTTAGSDPDLVLARLAGSQGTY